MAKRQSRPGSIHRQIVEILKQYPEGRTCGQVRHELEKAGLRADEQTYLDKRMRELPRWFQIKKNETVLVVGTRRQRVVMYAYEGEKLVITDEGQISQKIEAEVFKAAHGRCQMCGKTIEGHHVTLVIDHRRPRAWGGTNDRDNLWAICERCNGGKKAFFDSMDPDFMKAVTAHKSVHVRIGETLKQMGIGKRTPPWLLDVVADQEDWHKRLRELRYPVIGWKIDPFSYTAPSGRKKVDYVLKACMVWPDDPTGRIGEFERERKRKNREKRKADG